MPPDDVLQSISDTRAYLERWQDDHKEAASVVPTRGPGRIMYRTDTHIIQAALEALDFVRIALETRRPAHLTKAATRLRKQLDKLESSMQQAKS
jgi:hypothetical protein